jgi:uncharacterized protein (DUF952 family)
MSIIFHIASKHDWGHAVVGGSYAAASLASEGFIHCSTAEQVIATADRLFAGRRDLVLLCVDTDCVPAEIRYENLEGGATQFPHVYGALPHASIRAVHDFPPRDDGRFELPPALCLSSR